MIKIIKITIVCQYLCTYACKNVACKCHNRTHTYSLIPKYLIMSSGSFIYFFFPENMFQHDYVNIYFMLHHNAQF